MPAQIELRIGEPTPAHEHDRGVVGVLVGIDPAGDPAFIRLLRVIRRYQATRDRSGTHPRRCSEQRRQIDPKAPAKRGPVHPGSA
jgi:hypothetical protein